MVCCKGVRGRCGEGVFSFLCAELRTSRPRYAGAGLAGWHEAPTQRDELPFANLSQAT